MALVEEEVSGSEKQATEQVSVIDMNTQEVIKQLQEQVDQLRNAPVSNQAVVPNQADLLEKLVEKISGISKPENNSNFSFEQNYQNEADIDPNDVLPVEEQVTFIAHCVGYPIVDDLRNGKPVRVPFGKIVFEYESTKQVKNGKETDVHNFSKYTCKSRKELEWLRKHSLYKISFFENIKGAMSIDGARAIKLAQVVRGLNAMGAHDIVLTARNYGIEANENIEVLRGEIAMKIVDDQLLAEKKTTERIMSETHFEKMMIGDK